jgi:hypothetical protein
MRRFVIFLICLTIVLVAVDRIACGVAQSEIAQRIRATESVTASPKVKVHGFPFLTQALRGRYTRVDADLKDLSVQDGLTIDTLHLELRGVQVKISDVVNGSVNQVPVSSATTTATVSYSSLNAVVKANSPQNLDVKLAQGKSNRLAVSGKYSAGQLNVQIQGQAEVSVKGGALVVGLDSETVDALPSVVRSQLKSLIGAGYKLPALPFGFEATSVTVGPTGVTVQANATSVELN